MPAVAAPGPKIGQRGSSARSWARTIVSVLIASRQGPSPASYWSESTSKATGWQHTGVVVRIPSKERYRSPAILDGEDGETADLLQRPSHHSRGGQGTADAGQAVYQFAVGLIAFLSRIPHQRNPQALRCPPLSRVRDCFSR
jgi:hypothetical protein